MSSLSVQDLDSWSALGKSILRSKTLRAFNLYVAIEVEFIPREDIYEIMLALERFSVGSLYSPLVNIHISFNLRGYFDSPSCFALQGAIRTGQSLIRSVSFVGVEVLIGSPRFRSAIERLADNTSITSLSISGSSEIQPKSQNGQEQSSGRVFFFLFRALRRNKVLKQLRIVDLSDLTDDDFKGLMEVLQVNFTLESILLRGTPWNRDGKSAILEEALERKRRRRGYFSVLEQLPWNYRVPNVGRLFLCGPPFAGKTELSTTMLSARKKICCLDCFDWQWRVQKKETRIRRRTTQGKTLSPLQEEETRIRGIEVQLLQANDMGVISVWDLAGQWIYRTIQDLVFPRTSQPCIFLFVFSPVDPQSDSPRDVGTDFKDQLRSWLRYVRMWMSHLIHCDQVRLRNKLTKGLRIPLNDKSIICRRGTIQILVDGHRIFVESDGIVGDHIDILVKSNMPRRMALVFVQEHIIDELRKFCAVPEGCPGVSS